MWVCQGAWVKEKQEHFYDIWVDCYGHNHTAHEWGGQLMGMGEEAETFVNTQMFAQLKYKSQPFVKLLNSTFLNRDCDSINVFT